MLPFEEGKSQRVGKLCHISFRRLVLHYPPVFQNSSTNAFLPTVLFSSCRSLGPRVYATITLVFSSHVTNFHTLICFKKISIFQFTVMLARSSVAESFIRDIQTKEKSPCSLCSLQSCRSFSGSCPSVCFLWLQAAGIPQHVVPFHPLSQLRYRAFSCL